MFFKKPRQDINLINKSRIKIPNIMLKLISQYLEPPLEPTVISLKNVYRLGR